MTEHYFLYQQISYTIDENGAVYKANGMQAVKDCRCIEAPKDERTGGAGNRVYKTLPDVVNPKAKRLLFTGDAASVIWHILFRVEDETPFYCRDIMYMVRDGEGLVFQRLSAITFIKSDKGISIIAIPGETYKE